MLQSYQLFQKASPELVDEILRYMRDEERAVYKSALAQLAAGRKLRPAFIQKRPLDKQLAWFADSLRLRSGDSIAEQLLQVWLLKSKKAMLVCFLDAMGIEHDGEGSVEDLPDAFDTDKLKEGVGKTLEEHPADAVKVYLHLFQTQRPGGWPELEDLLENDERLAFG